MNECDWCEYISSGTRRRISGRRPVAAGQNGTNLREMLLKDAQNELLHVVPLSCQWEAEPKLSYSSNCVRAPCFSVMTFVKLHNR